MVTVYVLHQHSSAGSLWIPGPRPVLRACGSQSSTVISQYAEYICLNLCDRLRRGQLAKP